MATAAQKKEPKRTKREKLFVSKVAEGKTYPLDEAVQILKECATAKFKESVDISVNLGIDAKKSDQNVRGSTVLPHGNGKSVKVAVFAQGAKAEEAKAAGADIVGMQDLADKMRGGDGRLFAGGAPRGDRRGGHGAENAGAHHEGEPHRHLPRARGGQ